jgi:hypothetical protein
MPMPPPPPEPPLGKRMPPGMGKPNPPRLGSQIFVVKSGIENKALKNCHRPKAFCTCQLYFVWVVGAFCVMRTSLGNPRAGALLFWP